MSEIIFTVEEAPEGGYTARALGFSIFTEADTLPELLAPHKRKPCSIALSRKLARIIHQGSPYGERWR